MNKPTVPNDATRDAVKAALEGADKVEERGMEVTPEEEEPSSNSNFWSEMAEDADEDDEVMEEAEEEADVDGEGEQPEEVASESPEAEADAEVSSEPVTEVEKEEEPQVPPLQEEVRAQEPAQQPISQEQYAEMRGKALEKLANEYSLSEEEATALALEPEKVFPKLAAKIQLATFDSVMAAMNQMLPGAVKQISQSETQVQQVQQEFFSKWGQLRAHGDVVARIAAVYARVNPQASKEQAIRDIGMQASMTLGLPLQGVAEKVEEVVAPAKPAPTVTRRAPAAPPSNPFMALAEEFLQEDLED